MSEQPRRPSSAKKGWEALKASFSRKKSSASASASDVDKADDIPVFPQMGSRPTLSEQEFYGSLDQGSLPQSPQSANGSFNQVTSPRSIERSLPTTPALNRVVGYPRSVGPSNTRTIGQMSPQNVNRPIDLRPPPGRLHERRIIHPPQQSFVGNAHQVTSPGSNYRMGVPTSPQGSYRYGNHVASPQAQEPFPAFQQSYYPSSHGNMTEALSSPTHGPNGRFRHNQAAGTYQQVPVRPGNFIQASSSQHQQPVGFNEAGASSSRDANPAHGGGNFSQVGPTHSHEVNHAQRRLSIQNRRYINQVRRARRSKVMSGHLDLDWSFGAAQQGQRRVQRPELAAEPVSPSRWEGFHQNVHRPSPEPDTTNDEEARKKANRDKDAEAVKCRQLHRAMLGIPDSDSESSDDDMNGVFPVGKKVWYRDPSSGLDQIAKVVSVSRNGTGVVYKIQMLLTGECKRAWARDLTSQRRGSDGDKKTHGRNEMGPGRKTM